jgi:CheY-like chemotaxis protein
MQELLFGLGATAQNVRLAGDSNEALRLTEEWPPDLIFLDVELLQETGNAPSTGAQLMNGDDLGRKLMRAHPGIPVVVVTALDAQNPRVQGLRKTGAVDVIMKPVRAGRVEEIMARLNIRFPSVA